jgi:hypothetical protein
VVFVLNTFKKRNKLEPDFKALEQQIEGNNVPLGQLSSNANGRHASKLLFENWLRLWHIAFNLSR